MKARVKKTGEIIELHPYDAIYEKQTEPYKSKEHKICHLEGIEIFDEPDYWEKLKHQAAVSAMQGMVRLVGHDRMYPPQKMAIFAVECATALVEKLKEGK